MEENQVTQTDVSTESSTEVSSDSAATATPVAPVVQEQQKAEAPFHEHPRFKEIIDQNRTYRSELTNLQKQIAELSKPKQAETAPSVHPFISDLEKINPQY